MNAICVGKIYWELFEVHLIRYTRTILKFRKLGLSYASLTAVLMFIDSTRIHLYHSSFFSLTYFLSAGITFFTFYNTYYNFLKRPQEVEEYIKEELEQHRIGCWVTAYIIVSTTYPPIPFLFSTPWNIDTLYEKSLEFQARRKKRVAALMLFDR
jgi:hypothetical protein